MKIERITNGNAFAPCPVKRSGIGWKVWVGIAIATYIIAGMIDVQLKLLQHGL